jgi:serine/threonine protein kinase
MQEEYTSPSIPQLDYRADNRSDIFSLGVVFYEALGRQHPFLSPTWAQTVDRIIHQTPTLLKDLNPEIPDRLADIVNKCLQKEPENRYQSASIIAKDLYALNAPR